MAKKATKKKTVKKDPLNRRLKSAKFKNIDRDKAIASLREVIDASNSFLNQAKYGFQTMVDQKIFTYDDLQETFYKCELVYSAHEMGIEFEKDKKSFTPEQLQKVNDEWDYEIRESAHKSVRRFLGSFHNLERVIETAHQVIHQLDEEYVADSWSGKLNDNTTIMWEYKD